MMHGSQSVVSKLCRFCLSVVILAATLALSPASAAPLGPEDGQTGFRNLEPKDPHREPAPAGFSWLTPDGDSTGGASPDGACSPSPILGVSFSPDGKHLALGGRDGFLRVLDFNPVTLKVLGPLPAPVSAVAYSADGRQIAFRCGLSAIRTCESSSGLALLTMNAREAPAAALAWSPDSRQLAVRGGSKLRLFDACSGQECQEPAVWLAALSGEQERNELLGWQRNESHPGDRVPAPLAAWSGDGQWLALTGSQSGALHFFPANRTIVLPGPVLSLTFTRDSKWLLIAHPHALQRVYLPTFETSETPWPPGLLAKTALPADGGPSIASQVPSEPETWTSNSGATGRQGSRDETGPSFALAFSPSGESLAVAGHKLQCLGDSTARPARRSRQALTLPGPAVALAWSPDDGELAVAHEKGVSLIGSERELTVTTDAWLLTDSSGTCLRGGRSERFGVRAGSGMVTPWPVPESPGKTQSVRSKLSPPSPPPSPPARPGPRFGLLRSDSRTSELTLSGGLALKRSLLVLGRARTLETGLKNRGLSPHGPLTVRLAILFSECPTEDRLTQDERRALELEDWELLPDRCSRVILQERLSIASLTPGSEAPLLVLLVDPRQSVGDAFELLVEVKEEGAERRRWLLSARAPPARPWPSLPGAGLALALAVGLALVAWTALVLLHPRVARAVAEPASLRSLSLRELRSADRLLRWSGRLDRILASLRLDRDRWQLIVSAGASARTLLTSLAQVTGCRVERLARRCGPGWLLDVTLPALGAPSVRQASLLALDVPADLELALEPLRAARATESPAAAPVLVLSTSQIALPPLPGWAIVIEELRVRSILLAPEAVAQLRRVLRELAVENPDVTLLEEFRGPSATVAAVVPACVDAPAEPPDAAAGRTGATETCDE